MAFLSCCSPKMSRGLPLFSRVTTIFAHHVEVAHCGTFSTIQRQTSLSGSSLMCCFQWCGTQIDVWTVCGFDSSLKCNLIGSPVIIGRVWWTYWLNAEDENALSNQSFSLSIFSTVGSNRICLFVCEIYLMLL